MKPPKVVSREYKIMMDHRLFTDRKPAIDSFLEDLMALACQLKIDYESDKRDTQKREIIFLDSEHSTISLNGLILRQRTDLETGNSEYTLKYRSPDRYLAAAAHIQAAEQKSSMTKLEEDIAAPFRIQFSHSCSVAGPTKSPETLKEAADIYPSLADLERDGTKCPQNTRLYPVNAMRMFERVIRGPKLIIGENKTEVALILWSIGENGRPLVAEFSFRYKNRDENYSESTVKTAKKLFEVLQRLDWFLPEGRTKTQFAYHA